MNTNGKRAVCLHQLKQIPLYNKTLLRLAVVYFFKDGTRLCVVTSALDSHNTLCTGWNHLVRRKSFYSVTTQVDSKPVYTGARDNNCIVILFRELSETGFDIASDILD